MNDQPGCGCNANPDSDFSTAPEASSCCPPTALDRRQLLRATGAAAAGLMAGGLIGRPAMAGPFDGRDFDAIIPADKKLTQQWLAGLSERGAPLTVQAGGDDFIGMPIGGIGTGQVYLSGDGQLWYWNLTARKDKKNTPKGLRYLDPDVAGSPVWQGFALKVDGQIRTLDSDGFGQVTFTNQYPMARVAYADADCPVTVELEAYTPYIPMNREDSSHPVIVMRYTLTNPTDAAQRVSVAGWIENISNLGSGRNAADQQAQEGQPPHRGRKVGAYRQFADLSVVECTAEFPGSPQLENADDHCTFALGLMGDAAPDLVNLAQSDPDVEDMFSAEAAPADGHRMEQPFAQDMVSSLGRTVTLEPGASQTVSFTVSWRFENLRYGTSFGLSKKATKPGRNHYATLSPTAASAANAVAQREAELYATSKQWVETWYESSLPYWLLERAFIPIDCMQTQVVQRVYSEDRDTDIYNLEEGVRCCPGNCTHVWNYAQGLARIFPLIERECRDKIEFGLGFDSDSGSINHRYVDEKYGDAIDGACGTIIRVLRESQMTTDYRFLTSMWDRTRLAMDYVIGKWDADEDGLLAGAQHNTLDEPWYGAVPWLINVYHAALKASAVMARQMEQPEVAERYEAIVARGAPAMVEQLWNEKFGYFIHQPPADETKMHGSTNGCHIDQVLGDSWLYEVGLDPILPRNKTKQALRSLWKYNFSPDIGAFRKVMTNGRWYAGEGDAGLVMCSFPHGKIEPKSGKKSYAGYLNECMTGFEWQVAAHMIREGMLEEGLAIGKAIYDRYSPKVRNPYNEIECSDHYSRAMASYSAFLAVCGYRYDGPEGKLAFGPKMQPEKFKAAFTTAEGWGRFTQTVEAGRQVNTLELGYGTLALKQLDLDLAPGVRPVQVQATVDGEVVAVQANADEATIRIVFPDGLNLASGQTLRVAPA